MARLRFETTKTTMNGEVLVSEVTFNISEELAKMLAMEINGKTLVHTKHYIRHKSNIEVISSDKIIGGIKNI